ncbi:MAG: hypothetical protein V1838_04200 [Patescibacteria group bacterium]
MKKIFIEKNFSQPSRETITTMNKILDEYRAQGFRLSLRQLYYQLVARDYIPNNMRSYKNLGNLVSDARQAGLIDWDMIEDRGRETVANGHWENPAEIVVAAARQFRIDKWEGQPWHIEVMVEKDALSGVLEPVCRNLDIAITANKGYSSSSTMYEIGQRLLSHRLNDKQILVIYLGDHDPSGIDMTRDIDERLTMYSEISDIEVARIALNYDQVELWQPPENPAKQTDSRFMSYAMKFGESSWELDAVEPSTLADLINTLVAERRDDDLWAEAVEKENRMRAKLQQFVENYGD